MFSKEEKGILYLTNPVTIDGKKGDRIDMNKLETIDLDSDSILQGIKLEKTKKRITGPSIAASASLSSTIEKESSENLRIVFTMEYANGQVIVRCNLLDYNNAAISSKAINIPKEIFVKDFIEIMQTSKRIKYKKIKCLAQAIEKLKTSINDLSIKDNIILVGDELPYLVNIYDNKDKKVGIANRLICNQKEEMTLCEVVTFKDLDYDIAYKLEIVTNDKVAIVITDVRVKNSTSEGIKYALLDTYNSSIYLLNGDYNSVKPKCNLNLPGKSLSMSYLSEYLIKNNSSNSLNKYYKLNRKLNVIKIDIDKYMLM